MGIVSIENVIELSRYHTTSLDEMLEDDPDAMNNPNKNMPSVEYDFEGDLDKKLRMEKLDKVLKTLKPNQEKVIRMRLDDKTLRQIGDKMGLTYERIRQIETQAIGIIRRRI